MCYRSLDDRERRVFFGSFEVIAYAVEPRIFFTDNPAALVHTLAAAGQSEHGSSQSAIRKAMRVQSLDCKIYCRFMNHLISRATNPPVGCIQSIDLEPPLETLSVCLLRLSISRKLSMLLFGHIPRFQVTELEQDVGILNRGCRFPCERELLLPLLQRYHCECILDCPLILQTARCSCKVPPLPEVRLHLLVLQV